MQGVLRGVVALTASPYYPVIQEALKKVIVRKELTKVRMIDPADLALTVGVNGDFTTVTLFYQSKGSVFHGTGASKKSIKDDRNWSTGIIVASTRAIEDLEMELSIHQFSPWS